MTREELVKIRTEAMKAKDTVTLEAVRGVLTQIDSLAISEKIADRNNPPQELVNKAVIKELGIITESAKYDPSKAAVAAVIQTDKPYMISEEDMSKFALNLLENTNPESALKLFLSAKLPIESEFDGVCDMKKLKQVCEDVYRTK
jgi:uncharacterized protein YqeY